MSETLSAEDKLKKLPKKPSRYQVTVEVFNALTHGIAAILSVIGTIFLIIKGLRLESTTSLIAYLIYGLSLIILFTNSTLYHSFSFSKLRPLFQKLDHSSIYLLIAGTYTPYLMISIGGTLGYAFLFFVWAFALGGIIFELMALDKYPKLSTAMYLILGWIGIFILWPLVQNIEIDGVVLLAIGGLSYSFGTIFYSMKSKAWMHVVWHLFVIGGAFFMFISILNYV